MPAASASAVSAAATSAAPPRLPRWRVLVWLRGLGLAAQASAGQARATLTFVGELVLAFGRLLGGRSQMRWADLAWQLDQTGPRSVPIVALVCGLVGLILAYMGAAQLALFGAQSFIADLVAVGVVREIAALMTGVILAGRVGAAFAAQLGAMQANDEVDALRVMGIEPMDHLVLPRVLALALVAPLLTAIGAVVGLAAGAVVAVAIYGLLPLDFAARSAEALGVNHLVVGLAKGTVYALLVGLAGCLHGLASGRSAQAVGQATTQAVVRGIVWIVAAASLMTVLLQRLDW